MCELTIQLNNRSVTVCTCDHQTRHQDTSALEKLAAKREQAALQQELSQQLSGVKGDTVKISDIKDGDALRRLRSLHAVNHRINETTCDCFPNTRGNASEVALAAKG